MTGSIYTAMGAVMIIFGVSAFVLGNVLLRMWFQGDGRNGGNQK